MIIYARIKENKLIQVNESDWQVMLFDDGPAENCQIVYWLAPYDSSDNLVDYYIHHRLWQLVDDQLVRYSPFTGKNELELPGSYFGFLSANLSRIRH